MEIREITPADVGGVAISNAETSIVASSAETSITSTYSTSTYSVATETPNAEVFSRLIKQLSSSAPELTPNQLAEIVASPNTVLLGAFTGEQLVGCLTLVLFRTPSGLRARIEDVVVDEAARGQGAGRALNQRALELAQKAGARTVDLTSSPSRQAANALYISLGFEKRDTSVYRFEPGSSR